MYRYLSLNLSNKAATAESTPPDKATATRNFLNETSRSILTQRHSKAAVLDAWFYIFFNRGKVCFILSQPQSAGKYHHPCFFFFFFPSGVFPPFLLTGVSPFSVFFSSIRSRPIEMLLTDLRVDNSWDQSVSFPWKISLPLVKSDFERFHRKMKLFWNQRGLTQAKILNLLLFCTVGALLQALAFPWSVLPWSSPLLRPARHRSRPLLLLQFADQSSTWVDQARLRLWSKKRKIIFIQLLNFTVSRRFTSSFILIIARLKWPKIWLAGIGGSWEVRLISANSSTLGKSLHKG